MAEELTYKNEAAAGYDRAFAHIGRHFVPFLLRAAHLAPGMRVLDIAAGTRLGHAKNASIAVEDGQALSFSEGSFDAVVCSLGLMLFPDPLRGLTEFRRV